MSKQSLIVGSALVLGALAITWTPASPSAVARAARSAQGCDFAVSPTRVDAADAGQQGAVEVDTQAECAWTVSVDVPWIQLTVSGGAGPGAVSYVVSPKPNSPTTRQGRIKVRWNTPTAGQDVLVTQGAASCSAIAFPAPGPTSPQTFGGLGGGGNVWVLAEPPFSGPWLVSSAPDWITFTSPPQGVLGFGDGQTFFSVSPNPGTSSRTGTIVLCRSTLTVHQAGRSLRNGPYVPSDFDDDGIADLAVYRPSTGTWYVAQSRSGYSSADFLSFQWGAGLDVPIPGDFDGDARTDLAMYRPNGVFGSAIAANWNIRYSSNDYSLTTATTYTWPNPVGNISQDVPLLADFSGDGKQDFVAYRPSTGQWFILFTSIAVPGGAGPLTNMQWGVPGDVPVPADFDGDGRADIAVWRPSNGTWYIQYSSANYTTWQAIQWGVPSDIPMVGDFDGDRKSDPAIWRPSEGNWYILFSSSQYRSWAVRQWGVADDRPVPNDFDGDRITDLAVWRPSNGTWYLLFSSSGYSYASWKAYQWGVPGDVPLFAGR